MNRFDSQAERRLVRRLHERDVIAQQAEQGASWASIAVWAGLACVAVIGAAAVFVWCLEWLR